MKKNKRLIFLVTVFIIAAIITVLVLMGRDLFKKEQSSYEKAIAEIEADISESDKEVGKKAKINKAFLTKIATGTVPFDTEGGAGNDQSEDDDYVRTLDSVTWTVGAELRI